MKMQGDTAEVNWMQIANNPEQYKLQGERQRLFFVLHVEGL
jgi:hypothetical protein